jgi:hypothetical protein
MLSIRVSSKQLIFFQFKPKLNLFRLFFSLFFSQDPPQNVFGLFRCFGPVLKQTELMVWGIKKVYILTNFLMFRLVFCMFRLVFCLFRLFRNTETPCFDI